MKTNTKPGLMLALSFALIICFSPLVFSTDINAYDQYLISSLNDENIGIRTSAATLLGERKITAAVEPLINMLKNEKLYSARIVAAIALYRIGDERAIPVIKERAQKDKNKTVRHVLLGMVQEIELNQLAAK